MSVSAIRVQGLTKEYRIGAQAETAETLYETLGRSLRAPFRRAARMLRGEAGAASDLTETFTALDGVSFDVAQGDVVGIVGHNGAGKTTLLRILSGITGPSRGEAFVRGRVGSLLEVGTGFHPELTGRENIFLNGAILGMRRREIAARFDEIAEFAGVQRFLETPVKHYSTGMYLRLAFSVAAHLDAEILFVDEVLAVGDAEFQRKCLTKMHDVSESGRTVLFVSHNLAAVENLCSRTIWLERGRVVEDGLPSEIIPRYLKSYATVGSDGDLSAYAGRRGNGKVRFKRIDTLTRDGEPVDVVRAGEPLRLRLGFEVNEPVLDTHFGVKFFNGMGTWVAAPNTWQAGYSVPRLERGEGSIDLLIDTLYLMPDRYYLSLWCSPIGSEVYDDLDRCTTLDVEGSDYFGSGHGLGRNGVVFFPSSWSVDLQEAAPEAAAKLTVA